MYRYFDILSVVCLLFLTSCRHEVEIILSENTPLPIEQRSVSDFAEGEPIGMYLLNEGNMGSNKARLDYVDFAGAQYVSSIYTDRNPNVVKELGDVGNDLLVYGSKLYAVINCSHKVEVMDAKSCERLGQVDIPNCRYMTAYGGKLYVSSYVGPIGIDPNAQQGAVYEVDTATLAITARVTVGFQPEELAIVGENLYVVNSGGYRPPVYDTTMSVISLKAMKQTKQVRVGINPYRLKADKYGCLWLTTRGNYMNEKAKLHLFGTDPLQEIETFDLPVTDFCIKGDSLYYYAFDYNTNKAEYGIIDIPLRKQVTTSLITDGTESEIQVPYAIAVNPHNGDIYLTDAKNYVSSGMLHCYDRNGKRLWSVRAGDIPAHFAFVYSSSLIPHP
ncbi:MAG: YncE family protein [Paludibacteraceae bacterium]|nr:YncE family protein [Paludibacteraceae bacterium]